MSSSVLAGARTRSAGALLAAGVLWGTGGLAGAVLGAEAGLHPLAVAAYRLLIGGLVTAVLLCWTGGLRDLPRTAGAGRRLLAAGALLATYQACYFAAVRLCTVSVATMVTIGSVPVFVAAASAVLERRRPSGWTVGSIAAALLGLLLLTWSPGGAADRWRLAAGILLALLSGLGFAALTMLVRTPVAGLDAPRTTAFGCLAGGILLLPVALWLGMAVPARLDVLAVLGYLGVVPTAIAYLAYFRGLRDAHPVLAALSALLEPLTAALLAALLLGDELGLTGWCGAALLVAALVVGRRSAG